MKKSGAVKSFLKSFSLSCLILSGLILILVLWAYKPSATHSAAEDSSVSFVYKPSADEKITVFVAGCKTRASIADQFYLIKYDPAGQKISVLSIPAQTEAVADGKRFRLDKLYDYGGITMAANGIESLFGIKIERHLRADFSGLTNIVDFAGGMIYELDRVVNYVDEELEIDLELFPGRQTLDGRRFTALLRQENQENKEEAMSAEYLVKNLKNNAALLCEFFTQYFDDDFCNNTEGYFSDVLANTDSNLSMYDFVYRQTGFTGLIESGELKFEAVAFDGSLDFFGNFIYTPESLTEIYNYFK